VIPVFSLLWWHGEKIDKGREDDCFVFLLPLLSGLLTVKMASH